MNASPSFSVKLQIKKRGIGRRDANWINKKIMNPE